jgi:hypothetical protein
MGASGISAVRSVSTGVETVSDELIGLAFGIVSTRVDTTAGGASGAEELGSNGAGKGSIGGGTGKRSTFSNPDAQGLFSRSSSRIGSSFLCLAIGKFLEA